MPQEAAKFRINIIKICTLEDLRNLAIEQQSSVEADLKLYVNASNHKHSNHKV